jgi:hypothetical protein
VADGSCLPGAVGVAAGEDPCVVLHARAGGSHPRADFGARGQVAVLRVYYLSAKKKKKERKQT